MAQSPTNPIDTAARTDGHAAPDAGNGAAPAGRETLRATGPGSTVTPVPPDAATDEMAPGVEQWPADQATAEYTPGRSPAANPDSITDPPSSGLTAPSAETAATMEYPSTPPDPESAGTMAYMQETIDPSADPRAGDTDSFSLSEELTGPATGQWPTVAGYEILGELGRGGMGVVYQARQKGLNRLVALKMVLAGAHASEHQLIRFRAEAEAVARLLHPNIVQIYEINEQDGLPFFSLEFVDGGPLDKLVAGKPQPPRDAAQMVETLARTMYFAHERGVIHRDLKPGNILMTKDGVPKITDFGLAKQLEEHSSSQTRTGTIMGTPSYMSPEQARGEIRNVGPLSDLYTLGAILYKLLTGRPPFVGATTMLTVAMVINEEPVPPSRLRPDVPQDLETICLKCLQKETQKRYANCHELAEDLYRFQAGEPIKARPVGPAERLLRWAKRNPLVAALTGLAFALLSVIAIGSSAATVVIYQMKQKSDQNWRLAEEHAEAETKARKEADAQTKIAQEQTKIATNNGLFGMSALTRLAITAQEELKDRPDMQALRLSLARQAMGMLQTVLNDKNNATLGFVVAGAHMNMGQLLRQLGQTDQAMEHYLKARGAFESLAAADPESDGMRSNLASALTTLGDISLQRTNESAAALKFFREGLRLRQEILDFPRRGDVKPEYVMPLLAASYIRVGNTVVDPAEGREHYRKALALLQEMLKRRGRLDPAQLQATEQSLGFAYLNLGLENMRLGEPEEALKYLLLCRELRAKLAKGPERPAAVRDLAHVDDRLGEFYLRTGDPARAKGYFTAALKQYRRAQQLDPKDTENTKFVGRALYFLAVAKQRLREAKEADADFAEALRLRERLAKKDPSDVPAQHDWMVSLARAGHVEDAVKLAEKFRKDSPQDPGTRVWVARGYGLGAATADGTDRRKRCAEQAVEALKQAAALGYTDAFTLATEPDLDALRELPEYQQVLDQLRAKRAANAPAR